MEARALSVDNAASGYLRLRFVRAFAASWNVFVVAGLIGVCVGAAFFTKGPYDNVIANAASLPFLVVLLALVMLIPVVLGVALSSALTDALHRRLAAFAMLLLTVLVLLLALFAGLGAVGEQVGFVEARHQTVVLSAWQSWVMVGFLVLTAFVAFEGVGWAWWQLTCARPGFLAARGWRPKLFNLPATFRRHLGLPAFLAQFARGRLILTALYFLVAVLNGGLILALILPLMVFSRPGETPPPGALAAIGVMIALLALNLFGVGRIFNRVADARAISRYQHVREWDARAPILFLRAFDQDAVKLHAETADPLVKLPAGVGAPRTLDEILLENASPYGPLIAIGDPRDPTPPLGAARIFVPGEDNDWQRVVSSLVAASRAVVMCPTTSAGVRWELELLVRAGAQGRTIFLASPEIPASETEPLFATLLLDSRFPNVKRGQTVLAAYKTGDAWQVLTARRRNLQSYSIALTMALQAILGLDGVKLERLR